MKKTITFFATAALCGAAFAAANDLLISFSTPGPDRYADGTQVLDGECYALIWTPKGSTAVIAADGTVTGGAVALTAPVARNGRCPNIVFEVDAGDVATKYKDGEWSVYLLDTRRFGADGAVTLAGTRGGKPVLVNASGAVDGAKVATGGNTTVSSIVASCGAAASGASAVPAGAPQPRITGMRVADGLVYITVAGTVPYLQYGLSSGETPDAIVEKAEGAPRTGAATDDEEITLVTPAKKGGAFFKVGRK